VAFAVSSKIPDDEASATVARVAAKTLTLFSNVRTNFEMSTQGNDHTEKMTGRWAGEKDHKMTGHVVIILHLLRTSLCPDRHKIEMHYAASNLS
jgi:hypothetical protein